MSNVGRYRQFHSLGAAVTKALSTTAVHLLQFFTILCLLSMPIMHAITRFGHLSTESTDFTFNPLTAGAAYIWVFIFINTLSTTFKIMSKIKCDINQQDLKRVDLHFVKSE